MSEQASGEDSSNSSLCPRPCDAGAAAVAPWEHSAFFACVRDQTGRIVAVNPAFVRKFGRTPEAWCEREFATLLHAEDRSNWAALVAKLDAEPYRVEHETRWLTAQGWRWMVWEETAVVSGDAPSGLYRAIGRDVTKQRMSDEYTYRLTNSVGQHPVSIIITDPAGHVQYVNPKFTEVSGFTLEEVLSADVPLLRDGHETDEAYRVFWETIHSGRDWRGELRTRRKDGTFVWESAHVSPVPDGDGGISHFLCLKEDITERKRLESQLRQAQKMESLGTLSSGIAHDFNNLLAIISGYTEVCLARVSNAGGDETLRRHLHEIHSATQRSAGLVQRILSFSRKAEVRLRAVSLNKVVREFGSLVAETFPRTITIDYDLDEDLPLIPADTNQLQQIIMNLCVNARDAMPKGGLLTLATRAVAGATISKLGADPDQRYVCLRISDTGSGISDEAKSHLFEPFFTTKQNSGGTGLGLSMVYSVVLNHHGVLDVESSADAGTTFAVYLPASGESADPFVKAPSQTRSEALPHGSESLLIVEDEMSLRRLLSGVLEPCGYRVHCVADGREAVRYIEDRQNAIDAVLLDLNVPELAGLDVYRELKRLRPQVRVLVVSGHITKELRSELTKLGQRDFIAKPYRLDEICERLRIALDEV